MTNASKINYQRKMAGLPLVRYNIRKLGAEDILDLREAFEAFYAISDQVASDSRGFWGIARGHGYDLSLCHRDSRLFLTWHRAYVYDFEKALNTAFRAVRVGEEVELTLPYWDWSVYDPNTDAANSIPHVLNDETYVARDGSTKRNPLNAARSLYRIEALGLGGEDQYTVRYPVNFRAGIEQRASELEGYLRERNFMRFSDDFNSGAHGDVHIKVGGRNQSSPLPQYGGDMSQAASAAYDPIFWFNHCMVDRVWADWQREWGDASVPQHVRDSVVYGGFVGEQVLDSERDLKYIFSNDIVSPIEAGTLSSPHFVGLNLPDGEALSNNVPLPPTMTYKVGSVSGDTKYARLEFHQLKPPIPSYEIRVFINETTADIETPLSSNTYGGRLCLFGHGNCFGAPGHCNPNEAVRDKYDLRAKHPLRREHTSYGVDLSKGIIHAVSGLSPEESLEISLTLVVVDAGGNQVSPEEISYRNISLVCK